MRKFKEVRLYNRRLWLQSTNRKRYINDITTNSFECKWQVKFASHDKHNNFYCSLGEWNTHITDLLSDTGFDNYKFDSKIQNRALFRYYTRLLLCVSEIITDFQDFLIQISGKESPAVRKQLTVENLVNYSIQELIEYVNNICKHKTGDGQSTHKYHCINNHILYHFVDSDKILPGDTLNIKNLKNYQGTGDLLIEVISIESILLSVIGCYYVLDFYLENNYTLIQAKLSRFESPLKK